VHGEKEIGKEYDLAFAPREVNGKLAYKAFYE
jgi:hypothetical protein